MDHYRMIQILEHWTRDPRTVGGRRHLMLGRSRPRILDFREPCTLQRIAECFRHCRLGFLDRRNRSSAAETAKAAAPVQQMIRMDPS
jgi:hypothetical protein